MDAAAPLILTLALDPVAFGRFDRMRRAHFPPERNLIPAHLTLFHHLPSAEAAAIQSTLADVAAREAAMPLEVEGVRSLGRGVAFNLRSAELARLRGRLAAAWRDWLGPQDRQGFRPHVTVQNKVSNEAARQLHAQLEAAFVPFAVTGTGLLLWRYLGGPWDLMLEAPFAGGLPGASPSR